ncbi:MAG: HTH domain-containing protein [Planctomycetes bacterium]|nr:HTH domain-containing protein [Planctomycetota bacterium]
MLDDTASKILGALRTATASGKGLTLKELVSQIGVSEQSTVSRGIDRLRGMGAVIDNSLGGRGYVLVRTS